MRPVTGKRDNSVTSTSAPSGEVQRNGFVARAAKCFQRMLDQILPEASVGNPEQVSQRASARTPVDRINLKLADWEKASPHSKAVSGAAREIRDFVRNVESLGQMSGMELKLRLSGLGLEELPPVMADLQDLCDQHGVLLNELDLSQNKLKTLPESIGKLQALTSLLLDKNHFTEIPRMVKSLSALRTLQANDNKIWSVPDWLPEMANLRHLLLAGNEIKEIPQSLKNCGQLSFITFDFNPIEKGREIVDMLKARDVQTRPGQSDRFVRMLPPTPQPPARN